MLNLTSNSKIKIALMSMGTSNYFESKKVNNIRISINALYLEDVLNHKKRKKKLKTNCMPEKVF